MVTYIFKYTETDHTGQSEDKENKIYSICEAFTFANYLIYNEIPFQFYSENIIEVSPNIVAPEGYVLLYENPNFVSIEIDPTKLIFRKKRGT
jgi:hypothetical protein